MKQALAAGLLLAGCTAIPQPETPAPPLPPAARPIEPPRPFDFGFQGAVTQGGLLLGTAPADAVLVTLDGKPIPLGPGGRFVIGFGRDHGPSAVVEARRPDGGIVRELLTVRPRQWDIQSLPTLRRGTTPSPAFLRIRAVELAQIGAARRANVSSDGWQQRFRWPLIGRISGVFGSQRIYAGEPGAYHGGIDIARPSGTVVTAPADGVVVLAAARPFTLEGNLLMIDHGMGLNSAMLHLSRIDVKVGDRVVQGQPLGAVGTTGRSTGPHLHWGLRWTEERLDPALLVGPMPGAAPLPKTGDAEPSD